MTVTARQAARRRYRAELSEGVERFLEPRREDCPWCGSRAIGALLRSPDIVQRKPGRFTLERCRGCGHVFQNPRLNDAGLEFYYRDAYDGLGAESSERLFDARVMRRAYRRRAQLLRFHADPATWLDVGTGYGHFCRTARQLLPRTRFDGLDQGEGVVRARDRGWIDHAYQGAFPDLAETLAGRYDVVSMHHYLEHTLEPRREIAAAARVLRPGGHLLIEIPDPDCLPARLLGRYWSQWVQPQHLHLPPAGNLARALTEAGYQVVAIERRKADLGHDFLLAPLILLEGIGPDPRRPWAPEPPTVLDHLRRLAVLALVPPAAVAGLLLDLAVRPLLPRHSNVYRILAAKPVNAGEGAERPADR